MIARLPVECSILIPVRTHLLSHRSWSATSCIRRLEIKCCVQCVLDATDSIGRGITQFTSGPRIAREALSLRARAARLDSWRFHWLDARRALYISRAGESGFAACSKVHGYSEREECIPTY